MSPQQEVLATSSIEQEPARLEDWFRHDDPDKAINYYRIVPHLEVKAGKHYHTCSGDHTDGGCTMSSAIAWMGLGVLTTLAATLFASKVRKYRRTHYSARGGYAREPIDDDEEVVPSAPAPMTAVLPAFPPQQQTFQTAQPPTYYYGGGCPQHGSPNTAGCALHSSGRVTRRRKPIIVDISPSGHMMDEVPKFVSPPALQDPEAQTTTTGGPGFFKTAKHPTICTLHLAFKALTLAIFCFGSLIFGGFSGDFVFTFVFTAVAFALDFWVVKNVSGRLLVGMRWYNEVQDDGSNAWRYERATDEHQINKTDKLVFWAGLILWPALWSILTFFYFIQLQWDWMLLCVMGTLMGGANLVGFWKCSTESKRTVQELASSAIFKTLVNRAAAMFV